MTSTGARSMRQGAIPTSGESSSVCEAAGAMPGLAAASACRTGPAMSDAASEPFDAAASTWLESLIVKEGGPMPTREELINLLRNFLQLPVAPPSITAADPCEARLIQDVSAPTTFPHLVEIAGAPVHPSENNVWHGSRHHQEDAQWQQCATKMTRFGLRLVDRQGSMVKGQSPVRLAGVPQLAATAAWARTAANGAALGCVFYTSTSAFDYPGTAWISTAARYSRCVPHGAFRSGLARAESYNPIQALSLACN